MLTRLVLATVLLLAAAFPSGAQPFDPALYAPLKWRCIGPYRGGRTVVFWSIEDSMRIASAAMAVSRTTTTVSQPVMC